MDLKFSMYSGFSAQIKRYGFEYAAKTAFDLGFSYVEMFDMAYNDENVPVINSVESAMKAKDIFDSYGISVSCYSVATDIVTLRHGVKKNEGAIAILKKHVDITAALGCSLLHHTLITPYSFSYVPPTLCEVIPFVVDAAAEVADYAKEKGVTCIYENQGLYFNGVDGFGSFFSEIKKRCENVGVCGDMGNMVFVDELPVPFFEAFAADMKHVHIKDYILKNSFGNGESCTLPRSRKGTYIQSTVIGRGDLNISSCLKILKEHGYSGVFSLEDDYNENYSSNVQAAFKLVRDNF